MSFNLAGFRLIWEFHLLCSICLNYDVIKHRNIKDYVHSFLNYESKKTVNQFLLGKPILWFKSKSNTFHCICRYSGHRTIPTSCSLMKLSPNICNSMTQIFVILWRLTSRPEHGVAICTCLLNIFCFGYMVDLCREIILWIHMHAARMHG